MPSEWVDPSIHECKGQNASTVVSFYRVMWPLVPHFSECKINELWNGIISFYVYNGCVHIAAKDINTNSRNRGCGSGGGNAGPHPDPARSFGPPKRPLPDGVWLNVFRYS